MNRQTLHSHNRGGGTTLAKNLSVKVFGAKRKLTSKEYQQLAAEAALNLSLNPKELHAFQK